MLGSSAGMVCSAILLGEEGCVWSKVSARQVDAFSRETETLYDLHGIDFRAVYNVAAADSFLGQTASLRLGWHF